MATPRKSPYCVDGCGRKRTGHQYCAECASIRKKKSIARGNKKRVKEHHETPTYTHNRKVDAKCPRCEIKHRIWVNVAKHLIINKPLKKYCETCEKYVNNSFENEDYKVGA